MCITPQTSIIYQQFCISLPLHLHFHLKRKAIQYHYYICVCITLQFSISYFKSSAIIYHFYMHSSTLFNYSNRQFALTCTTLEITLGNMDRGKRRMLKRDRDTKAFSASSMLFSSESTYTANVTKHTCKNQQNNFLLIQERSRSSSTTSLERYYQCANVYKV